MKKLLLFIVSILFFAGPSSAQQFNAAEFAKHLGKKGTLCDTVKALKIINDTLTFLSMGGISPIQKYAIVIRGNKISLDWPNLKGKTVCVTGVFELNQNQPQIIVAEPEFIQVH